MVSIASNHTVRTVAGLVHQVPLPSRHRMSLIVHVLVAVIVYVVIAVGIPW